MPSTTSSCLVVPKRRIGRHARLDRIEGTQSSYSNKAHHARKDEAELDLAMLAEQFDFACSPSDANVSVDEQDINLDELSAGVAAHRTSLRNLSDAFEGLNTHQFDQQSAEAIGSFSGRHELSPNDSQRAESVWTESSSQGTPIFSWLNGSRSLDPIHLFDLDAGVDVWGEKERLVNKLMLEDFQSSRPEENSRCGLEVWSQSDTSEVKTALTSIMSF